MTYRIDRSQFVENGPTIAADAAIARIHRAAIRAVLEKRTKAEAAPADLKQAA